MKRKHYFLILASTLLALVAASCSVGSDDDSSEFFSGDNGFYASDGEAAEGTSTGNGPTENTHAGVVTAGEWNDLYNWAFWSKLMTDTSYADKSNYWQFYTNHRVAMQVTDATGMAQAGVTVSLMRGSSTLWQGVTDNHGQAECWVGLYQKDDSPTSAMTSLSVSISGQLMEGHPVECAWDSVAQPVVNHYVIAPTATVKQQADIAFIVDATGSMGDEIQFLKSDLQDIIGKAAAVRPEQTLRTAALFYRDEGDEYLTRHSDFTQDLSQTSLFVSKQNADGGGDYPEAVHSALEAMLQNLSWDENARTRLAFLILDAPAHHLDNVISSLHRSVQQCARQGIRLIPVAASGVDKNTEFMLRFFAMVTGGTYVFLTDDSGVGYSHLVPTVGKYKVELLNELLIRLISYYTE